MTHPAGSMPASSQKLAGRVSIITGAASGIGAATAELFASHGSKVALIDIDGTGLEQVAGKLRLQGAEVFTGVADVTAGIAARETVAAIVARWGRIDVVMPCSGISVGGTVATIDEAMWDKVFAVNVKGSYLWMHEALPHMIERCSGSVILLGSQLVASSAGNNAAYIASKGALATLAKTMAVDHARDGIRVNVLMPGVIDTAMSRKSLTRYPDPAATRERWANRHAMQRFGQPEEVARAALFLASDDSSFTTGSQLFVDGGWSAM
ncbi:SDR family oxidoreductase [Caenimonas aquaedulcis]|nr:SDR family oxidoreductase [Caenimonas aquaedulcis]